MGRLIGWRNRSASVTNQDRFSAFYRKKRDEEEGQIVIDPFQSSLSEATGRAQSRAVIQCNGFGLDATNEEKHSQSSRSIHIGQRTATLCNFVYHTSYEFCFKVSGLCVDYPNNMGPSLLLEYSARGLDSYDPSSIQGVRNDGFQESERFCT